MSLAPSRLTAVILATAVAFATSGMHAQSPSSPYNTVVGGLAGPSTSAMGVKWSGDLEAAKATAKASGKLLLVHFSTPSCGPCRVLDSQVFNQPTVAGPIHQKFVPVKINADQSQALAQSFGITQVPTDVIVTPQGQVVRKLVSPSSPMAYVSRMTEIAAAHASKGGAGFQLAAAQSPYVGAANNAYANLDIPSSNQPPAAATAPVAAAQPAAPQQVNNPYMASGRYGQSPAVGASEGPTNQGPTTPRPAPQVAAAQVPGAQAAPLQVAPTTTAGNLATQAPAQNSFVNNPYAAQGAAKPQPAGQASVAGAVAPKPSTNPAASNPPATAQASAPQLPPGSPPLGFEGYCPVTMKKSWKWARGDAKWGAIHRGRTYLFAGATQRDEFLKNPDMFSPAMSGLDPVLALEQGKQTPGLRKFALEYQNQFYLFSSEESLNKFWTNAEGYAQGVRQAMTAQPGRTVR